MLYWIIYGCVCICQYWFLNARSVHINNTMQCRYNTDIVIFSKHSQEIFHNSEMRVGYGVSIVSSNSDIRSVVPECGIKGKDK